MDRLSEFAYWRIFSYISAMKRHRLLIIPLMLVVMTSCRRERSIDGYPFSPATGNALFDSLTACVWSGFDNDMPAAAIKPLVDRADSVSRRHPADRLMRARLLMMRGDICYKMNSKEQSCRCYAQALGLLDSARYPHDFNKARLCHSPAISDFEEKYEAINRSLRYFETAGDSLNTAMALRFMLILQHNIAGRESGHAMALRAEKIYESLGLDAITRCNRINVALTSPDSIRASMMRQLLDDTVVCRDPARKFSVLVNCGIFTDSIAYIRRAARLKEQYPRLSSTTYVSVLMASHEMRYGDPRRALPLARKAKAESDSTRNLLNQIYSLYILSGIHDRLGHSDSALFYYRQYVLAKDSFNVESQRNLISTSSIQNRFEREQQQVEYKLKTMRLWIFIAVTLLLTLGLGVMFIVYRRLSRRRLEQIAREAELRHSKSRLAARAAVIDEVEQTMKSIREAVRSKTDRNGLAADIEKILSLRRMAKRESDNCLLVADEVNPDFGKRLRKACAGITESQMTLASYIAAGMTSRQIARIQNISYDSVKKARYRLRQRLGLSTADSLEEHLRSFMQ